MLNYNPDLYHNYDTNHIMNINLFQKALRGRITFATLYSINRNSVQSEAGKMKSRSGYLYHKILNFPVFNVQQSEKAVTFDFDNGGYRVDGNVRTTATVLSDIYQIENDDIIVFHNIDNNLYYNVEVEETNLFDNNLGNIKNITLKSEELDVTKLEMNVEMTLNYNFENNNLLEVNLRDKIIAHFDRNIKTVWNDVFKDNFDIKFGKGLKSDYDQYLNKFLKNNLSILLNTYIDSLREVKLELEYGFEDYDLETTPLHEINKIHDKNDIKLNNYKSFLYYLQKIIDFGEIYMDKNTVSLRLEI